AEAERGSFDVIVLDVMLPGGSGLELCRDLRARGIETPILMLTARDAVDDRVVGLEVGADDYVTKPFAFRELVARVRALARRRPALVPRVATVVDLEVDLTSRKVRRGGRPIELTAKEFALLEFFVLHRGEVVDAVEELHIPERLLYLFDADGHPVTPAAAANWIALAARDAARMGSVQRDQDPRRGNTLRLRAERFTLASGVPMVAVAVADK